MGDIHRGKSMIKFIKIVYKLKLQCGKGSGIGRFVFFIRGVK